MAIVNRVIHDFKGILGTVKTANAVFFGKFLHHGGVNPGREGVANICCLAAPNSLGFCL
jgi:hypothetical protein